MSDAQYWECKGCGCNHGNCLCPPPADGCMCGHGDERHDADPVWHCLACGSNENCQETLQREGLTRLGPHWYLAPGAQEWVIRNVQSLGSLCEEPAGKYVYIERPPRPRLPRERSVTLTAKITQAGAPGVAMPGMHLLLFADNSQVSTITGSKEQLTDIARNLGIEPDVTP